MVKRFLCLLLGHKIDRKRVWHDSLQHRTTCGRCRCAMIKENFVWRPFDCDRDADGRRDPHPHYDRAGA